MIGTYWDDSWHTDRGRDEFAIPPHLLLYAGVAVALVAVGAWCLDAVRSGGWPAARQSHALRLALLGAVTTMLSAPVDEWWHQSFGRDAVLWSPPHLLGVAGMVALATGLLAGAAGAEGRLGRGAQLVLAGGVVVVLQVPVLEYDSDVPQFSAFWYLPVSIAGACLSFWLVDRLVGKRWAATQAAVLATLLRIGAIVFLGIAGFSSTTVPPLLLGAVMFDVLARSSIGMRLWASALALVGGWWVAIQLQPVTATPVEAIDLAAAALVGLAGLIAVAVRQRPSLGVAAGVVVVAVIGVAVSWTAQADAHDPGQGDLRGRLELSVDRDGQTASVSATAPVPCDGLKAVRTVARRAGTTVIGELAPSQPDGSCRWSGELRGLDEGAWFVYVEFTDERGPVEAWVQVGDDESLTEVRDAYLPVDKPNRSGQVIVGAALLAAIVGLLASVVRLASRAGAGQAPLTT